MEFCTKCGNKLEEHWLICPNCGTSLKEIDKPKQKDITPQQEIKTHKIPTMDKKIDEIMEKRNKIFLITGIIIGIVISASFYGIIVILKTIENDYTRRTFYLEAREEHTKYCYIINFSNDILDMLTFSFTTKPNGLIEVSPELFGLYAPLFSATNVTDYELIFLESDSSLRFCNLNWYDIKVSVKYKIEPL